MEGGHHRLKKVNPPSLHWPRGAPSQTQMNAQAPFAGKLERLVLSLHLTRTAMALVVASAGLMMLWSFVIPVFESPDEQAHWQYARYVRANKKLPLYDKTFVEANSPPLYYLVLAPFATYSEIPPSLSWDSPEGRIMPALPRLYQNSNSDYVRYWSIRGARLITVLISLVTVLFCYASAVEATGREATGLLAAALILFHSVTAAWGSYPARAMSSSPIWSASDSWSRLNGSWNVTSPIMLARLAVPSLTPVTAAAPDRTSCCA